MSEFKNRIELQREVIKILNSTNNKIQIAGLSKNAIQRWIIDNRLDVNSEVVTLISQISKTLFFLANKSQEQITQDYKDLSSEVSTLISELRQKLPN